MKNYKIFENPQGDKEAVKVGWSWPAFFFSIIWALVKKMYPLGVGLFVGFFIFGFILGLSGLAAQVGDTIINILSLVISIIFGVNGNKWRGLNLQKRGFNLKETVAAGSPESAISIYLEQKKSQALSLENPTKKCPACAETIKLEAKKCHFCGEEMDPEEVERQLKVHRAEIADAKAKKEEGK